MSSGTFVCIDLGPQRVVGVEVIHGRIERSFGMTPLPGSLAGGGPADPARLARQLRAALDAAGVDTRRARVAVPDAALLTRVVQLPPMPRRHLRRAATYVLERAIPIPAGEVAWSWTSARVEGGRYAVRVVAGWRDVVEKLRQSMAGAGLELEVVEPRSSAVESIFRGGPALLLEHVAGTVLATAVAPGLSPFTAHASAPSDDAGWPSVLESLVLAARRHLGPSGRDLEVLVTQDLAAVVPEAIGARPVASLLAAHFVDLTGQDGGDAYLAAIGLAIRRQRSPALKLGTGPVHKHVRSRVSGTGVRWVPALAVVSIASWSAVAAGTALLLGWHPSWPLAP